MAIIATQPLPGLRDFAPEDLRPRTWLFGLWREIALSFGYEEYDSCVLESEELYTRKAGDEITRQLYNFTDKGDRKVSLRPEMTPSLARMILGKGNTLPMPARWFAIPQCFRYERTQRGRKREHFQWNMDCVGLASVAAEAELMQAQITFLRRVGLGDGVVIKVSDRRILQQALEGLGITGERFAAVCVILDKRDKIGDDKVREELSAAEVDADTAGRILGLLDIKGMAELETKLGADAPGVKSLRQLHDLADAAGFAKNLAVDLSVVRGLSYYTGTVWELFDTAGTIPRAIAGGGRYDKLMETFGGPATPMVGFGFGDVVILDLLEERKLIPALKKSVDAVVAPLAEGQFATATKLATALRAKGQVVLVDWSQRRFKHLIERAELDGAKLLYILGGDEVAKGVVTVRAVGGDRNERKEEKLPLSDYFAATPAGDAPTA